MLAAAGENFSAGLDLAEIPEMSAAEGVHHSHAWYRVFEQLQFGCVPVISLLQGAVVGVTKLIGFSRVTEMLLTGRIYNAQAFQIGLTHYTVVPGAALAKAQELALRIAGNAPMSNDAILRTLPLIANNR